MILNFARPTNRPQNLVGMGNITIFHFGFTTHGAAPYVSVPGASSHKTANTRRMHFYSAPHSESPPAKPFRPIWDRPHGGKVEQHRPATAPRPPPLPPVLAAPKSGLDVSRLPRFIDLAPPAALDYARQIKDAADMQDAMSALARMQPKGNA